ncbi:MAG: bifunctional phosphopantothenoylcysteine decarboxylase/phosphopantothenate--cysteine ligase CoaBC [Pseudohongiellaceae bacterium]
MLSLTNKRILLGITGGIAAYKSAELTRLLVKAGAEVRVAMTPAATEFITPLTMQALSGNRVHLELLDAEAEAGMGHIELARWADLVIVAPATADAIARMARGQADDLLTTLLLATPAPIAVAPAMNQGMWNDVGTQSNLDTLRRRQNHILGPDSGEQACGDVGPGRMLEPEQIADACAALFTSGILSGKQLLITGGPTREAIDPVRYISNHSSGKMAYALAEEAAAAGARVTLVSGPVNLGAPERVNLLAVISALEMHEAVMANVAQADIFIGVAAVADYRPAVSAATKLKKSTEELQLNLVKNPDIISEVAGLKPRPFMVGFAAETENLAANGKSKLKAKRLDLLFANMGPETFDNDSVAVTALADDLEQELPAGNKHLVARAMLQLMVERMGGRVGGRKDK